MAGPKIAYFVTSHGFGHGSRSAAVIDQLFALAPDLELHLYTDLPEFLIRQTVLKPLHLHPERVDLGLVQHSPVQVDLEGSCALYRNEFAALMAGQGRIAVELKLNQVEAVVCDIAPLGIAAAGRAGIPSFLVENFTWDWILAELKNQKPELSTWVPPLAKLFAQVGQRFRCQPYCGPLAEGQVEVGPVFREPRAGKQEIRAQLGVLPEQKLVFLTLGGWIGDPVPMAVPAGYFLVIPGSFDREIAQGNKRYLPWESRFYHPDLLLAADLVICKLGYSTVVEAWRGKTALLYLGRPDFPESTALEAFVLKNLAAQETTTEALASGDWALQLNRLSWPPGQRKSLQPGALSIASSILKAVHEQYG